MRLLRLLRISCAAGAVASVSCSDHVVIKSGAGSGGSSTMATSASATNGSTTSTVSTSSTGTQGCIGSIDVVGSPGTELEFAL